MSMRHPNRMTKVVPINKGLTTGHSPKSLLSDHFIFCVSRFHAELAFYHNRLVLCDTRYKVECFCQ